MSQRLLRGKGRRTGKKRVTLKVVNKKVNKILRQIEKKQFTADLTFTTAGSGLMEWVSPIKEGDETGDRDGAWIVGKTFRMRYSIEFNVLSTHDFEIVRILIIVDKQADGIEPLATTLLATVNPYSFKSRATGQRFRILYDRAHTLNRFVTGLDVSSQRAVANINLRDLHMSYNLSTVVQSTGAGGEKNQLYLVLITDASSNPALFLGSSELIYTDF